MKILIFGASGMVGQGVLLASLNAVDVTQVVTVGRGSLKQTHEKLLQIVHSDLMDLSSIEDQLTGFDACFFCLGVSSGGMTQDAYTKLTYDLTLSVANTLARLNPQMTFTYISGSGTDSSEKGGVMWARVKGRTENALLKLPFKAAYMFRPGIIAPLDGIQSKTTSYRILYKFLAPTLPILMRLMPNQMLTTRSLGEAMLKAARNGAPKAILEASDINLLANS